jgi:hypothetical protein
VKDLRGQRELLPGNPGGPALLDQGEDAPTGEFFSTGCYREVSSNGAGDQSTAPNNALAIAPWYLSGHPAALPALHGPHQRLDDPQVVSF